MKTGTKILAVLAFFALCSTSLADELLVPSQYTTIQAAIDDANDGDTAVLAPGTYTGPGNRDIDFLGKALAVKSETGPENCIIDCQNSGPVLRKPGLAGCGVDIKKGLTLLEV